MSLKKLVIVCGLGTGLVGMGAIGGATFTRGSMAGAAEDKFPHMHDAGRALMEARKHLEMASEHYQGHRVKAIEATNTAIHEIETAIGEKIEEEHKK